MSFYAYDNPNPNGNHWHTGRRTCQHGIDGPHILVVHVSTQLPDYAGEDTNAEALAHYMQSTSRAASWHYSADSDSRINMLPVSDTAWHVRGYNRCGIGLEIATVHDDWDNAPERWLDGIFEQAQGVVAEANTLGIPSVRLTKDQVDAGGYGFVAHSDLDPDRRKDPGPTFDWGRLLEGNVSMAVFTDEEIQTVKDIHASLAAVGSNGGFAGIAVKMIRLFRGHTPATLDESDDLDDGLAALEAAIDSINTVSEKRVLELIQQRVIDPLIRG